LGPQGRELAEEIGVIRTSVQRFRKRCRSCVQVPGGRSRKCRPERLGGQVETGTGLYAGELCPRVFTGTGLRRALLRPNLRGDEQDQEEEGCGRCPSRTDKPPGGDAIRKSEGAQLDRSVR
jgi:hypothetical protein